MRKIIFLVFAVFFVCLQSVYSQITTHELPISIQRGLSSLPKENADRTVTLPIPDLKEILREDSIYQEKNPMGLRRTSIAIPLERDINRDGIWTSLEDGGKLWQMEIHADKALALDFVFRKFWLPKGGKFFIFNPFTKETIGAITSQYLAGDKQNPHRFSTSIVKGDNVILEYYQPAGEREKPIVIIEKAYYSYYKPHINTSSDCEVNVNCNDGTNWQFEKDAVALVYRKFGNWGGWCSGSLVNNTQNDFTPYFLTANHCLKGDFTFYGGPIVIKDAISDNDLSDWVFIWGYEQANCYDSTQPDYTKTTTGAIIKANSPYTDFALLQLQQDPRNLSNYVPYYLGWDASGNTGTGGVCIHHPEADVKKISTYDCTPFMTFYESPGPVFWGVQWIHGITEKSSSGSPLINSNHKVIGQLRGHTEGLSCSDLSETSKFGQLSISWTGNNNSDNRRRLNYWLDPNGTNTLSISGISPLSISGSNHVCSTATYTISNLISGASVVWSASNSNLSIISGQGTSTATFQKNANGSCVITAQVSFGTSTLNFTKNVWAGTPTAPTILGWPNTNLFLANSQYQLYASVNSQAQVLEYQWVVVRGATITSGGNTDSPIFTMNSSGSVRIGVRARNACGWGPYTYMNGGITNDNGQTPINSPGNNIVNIPLPGEGEYEIMLWNTNRLIRTVKTSQSSYDVDLNGLPSDLYIIKVMKDGQSIYQLKVKK